MIDCGRKKFRTVSVFLSLALMASPAFADLNILAIGDSHTEGDIGSSRASYRPYLDQSIRNHQSVTGSATTSVTVNWLGTNTNTAYTPTGSNPITITGDWTGPPSRDQHQATGGVSSAVYASTHLTTATNQISATSSTDDNLALILLGTNDFAMFPNASVNGPNAVGWTSNRSNPLDVVDSIKSIVQSLQVADPNIQTLIAAIPPVDSRQQYSATSSGRLWLETDRVCTATGAGNLCNGTHQDLVHWDGAQFVAGGGVDNGVPTGRTNAIASSNDIIGVVNRELQAWANLTTNTNIGFVDPLDTNRQDQLRGSSGDVAVDGGDNFDLTPDGTGHLDDLSDGLHFTAIGDQYYAAGFWEQGVRLQLIETANAQAVPEPSSFLFVGLVAVGGIGFRRFRRLSKCS